MMTKQQAKQKIKSFLTEQIRHENLQDDEDIFAGGYINSMFAMQLVLFIESQLGIQLSNRDIRLDNFRTVEAMVDLIERKRVG
jgi:methoxymalonate biosynthesis acyl carrier protein